MTGLVVTLAGTTLILSLLLWRKDRTVGELLRTIWEQEDFVQRLVQTIAQKPLMNEAVGGEPLDRWVIEDEYEVEPVTDPEWIGEDPSQIEFLPDLR